MNCFDEATIQRFVDGECSKGEQGRIKAHFNECPDCFELFKIHKQRSANIKRKVNSLNVDEFMIPEFVPVGTERKIIVPFRRKLVYGMAAASVLLILVLVFGKFQSQRAEDTFVFYSLDYEVDANKPITEQDMVMYYTDENGNTFERVLN